MTKNRAFLVLDTTPGNDLVHAGRASGIESAAKAKAPARSPEQRPF
jgi:hypothetical protein